MTVKQKWKKKTNDRRVCVCVSEVGGACERRRSTARRRRRRRRTGRDAEADADKLLVDDVTRPHPTPATRSAVLCSGTPFGTRWDTLGHLESTLRDAGHHFGTPWETLGHFGTLRDTLKGH